MSILPPNVGSGEEVQVPQDGARRRAEGVTPLLPQALKSGRGDWIRTSDPLRPRQVRYQAALRPDSSAIIPRRPLPLHVNCPATGLEA